MFLVLAHHNMGGTESDRLHVSPLLLTTSDRKAYDTAMNAKKLGFKFVSRRARVEVYWLRPGQKYQFKHFASTDLSHQNSRAFPLVFDIQWRDGLRRPTWGNTRYLKNVGPGRRR
jgi:hypothetical protein